MYKRNRLYRVTQVAVSSLLLLTAALSRSETKEEDIHSCVRNLGNPDLYEQATDFLLDRKEEALPALLEGLHFSDPMIRGRCAFLLGKIGSVKAEPGLIEASRDTVPFVRAMAMKALGAIATEHALEVLALGLSDPDASVRREAAAGLGLLKDDGAFELLVAALSDPDALVRQHSLGALSSISPEGSSGYLARALAGDPDPEVRALAADLLVKAGKTVAARPLVDALSDPVELVRLHANLALKTLTRRDFGYNPALAPETQQGPIKKWKSFLKIEELPRVSHEIPGKPTSKQASVSSEPIVDASEDEGWKESEALIEDGRALLRQRRWLEALRTLRQAQRKRPDDPRAFLSVALSLKGLGRLSEAKAMLEEAVERFPGRPDAPFYLAQILRDEGKDDSAAPLYARAISLDPSLFEARSDYAIILYGRGKAEEAEALMEEALKENGHLPQAHRACGYFFRATGRTSTAIQHFENAIRLSSGRAQYLCDLGDTYLAGGQLVRAEEAFRKAVEADGACVLGYLGLASIRLFQTEDKDPDFTEALFYGNLARRIAPDDPKVLQILEKAYRLKGDRKKSDEMRERRMRNAAPGG